MASWLAPALGAIGGVASGLFGGGRERQESRLPEYVREAQHRLISPDMGGVWSLPEVGYGPVRVHQGPSPAVESSLLDMIARGIRGTPYERSSEQYALNAITGGNLYGNPAMGPLGYYGMGGGMPNLASGPGRQLMLSTARGSGYQNPYLDAMVNQAQRRTAANVASMFGGRGMGGSSMETQLAARELGDIASRMYGGAYEAERGRQTAMQQALGGLETSRLGQALQGRGQSIQAGGTLGQLYAGERGLQQDAALNVGRFAQPTWQNLQQRLQAAQGLESYRLAQLEEERQAWQADQMAPYNRLGFISSVIAGQPYSQDVRTTVNPNLMAMGLGGASLGLGLRNAYNQAQVPYTSAPMASPASPYTNPATAALNALQYGGRSY